MKIVFEINHPAQAHLFRNVIKNLNKSGNFTTVLFKDNKVVRNIFEDCNIPVISLGKKGKSLFSKAFHQIAFLFRIWKLQRNNHFDLGVGVSVSLPLFSRVSRMKSIVLDDDDKKATPLFALLAHRNADALLRPGALSFEGVNQKTIYYNGFHELAYLHPAVFTPEISMLEDQGIRKEEPYFILRLVALQAHHDKGIKGLDKVMVQRMVDQLRPFGRIIITSEIQGPEISGAEPLWIHPSRLHHLIAFSKLVITDGQTLCSEAACLGVPSVRVNDFAGRITTLEVLQSKWQLTFAYKPTNFDQALEKILAIAKENTEFYRNQRDKMVAESINVSDFLTWFISNYPRSGQILENEPGYLDRFKS